MHLVVLVVGAQRVDDQVHAQANRLLSLAFAARDDVANDVEFSSMLLSEAGVALVPGSAFGLEGYVRLSFATDMDTLDNALERLEKALGSK